MAQRPGMTAEGPRAVPATSVTDASWRLTAKRGSAVPIASVARQRVTTAYTMVMRATWTAGVSFARHVPMGDVAATTAIARARSVAPTGSARRRPAGTAWPMARRPTTIAAAPRVRGVGRAITAPRRAIARMVYAAATAVARRRRAATACETGASPTWTAAVGGPAGPVGREEPVRSRGIARAISAMAAVAPE